MTLQFNKYPRDCEVPFTELGAVTTHPPQAFKLLSLKRGALYTVVAITFPECKIASLLSVLVSSQALKKCTWRGEKTKLKVCSQFSGTAMGAVHLQKYLK